MMWRATRAAFAVAFVVCSSLTALADEGDGPLVPPPGDDTAVLPDLLVPPPDVDLAPQSLPPVAVEEGTAEKGGNADTGRSIIVDRTPGGGITVHVTETIDGREFNRSFEAENLSDLRQRHPEGYEYFVERLKAERPAKAPALLPAKSLKISMRGEKRVIRRQDAESDVEVEDQGGGEIVLRFFDPAKEDGDEPEPARTVTAANLEELREKSAADAAIYERIVGEKKPARAAPKAPAPLVLRMPPAAPLPSAAIPAREIPERVIQAETASDRVEIRDRSGTQIVVRVQSIARPGDGIVESRAESLTELLATAPDAARLYSQFTGELLPIPMHPRSADEERSFLAKLEELEAADLSLRTSLVRIKELVAANQIDKLTVEIVERQIADNQAEIRKLKRPVVRADTDTLHR